VAGKSSADSSKHIVVCSARNAHLYLWGGGGEEAKSRRVLTTPGTGVPSRHGYFAWVKVIFQRIIQLVKFSDFTRYLYPLIAWQLRKQEDRQWC
jgi:hypothetical protein